MFPSANHNNGYFVDPLISLPFFSDVNTSSLSKHEQDPLLLPFSSFSIPSSPFYLYHDHYQDQDAFLPPLMDNCTTPVVADAATDVTTEISQKDKQVIPKKRSVKRDRHSKINTAQGLRDRRMRLSLEVARKFFDLQDILEFDKASKTVEWLLKQSELAIKELTRRWKRQNGNGSPCSSECDVVSGVFDESMDDSNNSSAMIDDFDKFLEITANKEKKITTRTQKSRGIVTRESRKQARARAKKRTMEKMLIRNLSDPSASEEIGTKQILEIADQESGTVGHNYNYMMKPSNMEDVAQLDEAKEIGLIEEQIVGNSYSFIGTYFQNNGISQEHPFTDFQMLPRPWEAHSNSTHLWSQ